MLLATLSMAPTATAARGETLLVSRAPGLGGAAANSFADFPSVSADGRFVAFESDAQNLTPVPLNGATHIFVRDTLTGSTTLVSRANGAGGAAADSPAFDASISVDGRLVAFRSAADNLSTGDNNSFQNVFVRDLAAGTTTLMSRNAVAGADDDSGDLDISADGRFVAFQSDADNLSTGDENGVRNIFRQSVGSAGAPTLMSRRPLAGANGDSESPSISGDGRLVAFHSTADNLSTDGDNNDFFNVFVQDAGSPAAPTLVSRNAMAGADGDSFGAELSADGRFVAFHSAADNLSSADSDSAFNIFRQSVSSPGAPTLVSRAATAFADGSSFDASLSADGRFVAFMSRADNLSTDDDNSVDNIFVRDTLTAVTTLANRVNGVAGAGATDEPSGSPSLSADGRFVAFHSEANNLSTIDNDAFDSIFRRDLRGGPPSCSNTSQVIPPGTATKISLTCSDADGDTITRSIVSGPARGSLGAIDQATGAVTYTPGPPGSDSFQFRATDATGASNTATASLTVLRPGRCANRFRGTSRGETLTGTVAGDRIRGLGGNDVLDGLQGADCLEGGSGRDRLLGRSGSDRLTGGSGRDRLSGGSGRDRLSGGSGRDRLSGGSGRDRLTGGAQRDSFNAGSGNDRINSADGNAERVRCGRGTDRVRADREDVLIGCERVRRV